MMLVMAFLEVIGVASVVPFLTVLANPSAVETNPYLMAAYNWLGFGDADAFMVFLGAFIFVALLVSISFRALTSYVLMRFTQMRGYSLGRRLVSGYLAQPYEWFLSRHSADLATTVLNEVQQVVNGSIVPAMHLFANGIVALALLLLLVASDPFIAAAVAIGFGGAYSLIYLLLIRYLGRIGAGRVMATRERFGVMSEAFGGIKDVKIGGLESTFLERFENPALRHARFQAASQVVGQLPRYALEILAFGSVIIVALYLMTARDGLQSALPMLGLYALAGYRLLPAMQSVYAELTKLRFSQPAVDALYKDLLTLSELPPSASRVVTPIQVEHEIALAGVTYAYPASEKNALEGLDLVIPAQKRVGLVGHTGSGKTTTVDIILGLLTPAEGALLVDGVPVSTENVQSWRRSVGYVPQHIFLADDTIAANIAFGVPLDQIEPGSVERAARIANLHDFVASELPRQYETKVGERGVRLSGGQRQRIGIARALYHQPQVLVLDEATSALDNLTEQVVMEALENLGHEITVILIAHRLSTVRNCDRIYLLDNGRLAGKGTYDELVAKNLQFRRMAKANANS